MSLAVYAPYLIAAAVVGLPVAIGISNCSREPRPERADEPPPVVNADTVYPNNYFLPGAGYYHAPYRSWFPLPFNQAESGRGWYRGGAWRPTPQADAGERGAFGGLGGAGGAGGAGGSGAGTSSFAGTTASRPSPDAVIRANAAARAKAGGIMRGGFGHSSRPSIS